VRLRRENTILRYLPRERVQVARASVVAKSLPALAHATWWRRRECCERRKAAHESLVEVHHARHLRLLQHGFGHEDVIRIARPPPTTGGTTRAAQTTHKRAG